MGKDSALKELDKLRKIAEDFDGSILGHVKFATAMSPDPIKEFVLGHGYEGEVRKFDKETLRKLRGKTRGMQAQQCFYNGQSGALLNDDFEYVEGWYRMPKIGVCIAHGWLEYEGYVVEPTIRGNRKRVGILTPEPGSAYWGLKIPSKFIGKQWHKTQMVAELLPAWIAENVELENVA